MVEIVIDENELYKHIKNSDVTAEHVAKTILSLSYHWTDVHHGLYMRGVKGAEDWLGYEHKLWTLGENLRILLKNSKTLKANKKLNDAFLEIALNRKLGKGRQTFVTLLGRYSKCGEYDLHIGSLLDDRQVCGQAIKALIMLKADAYVDQVQEMLSEKHSTWIKNAAKKYLKLYSL